MVVSQNAHYHFYPHAPGSKMYADSGACRTIFEKEYLGDMIPSHPAINKKRYGEAIPFFSEAYTGDQRLGLILMFTPSASSESTTVQLLPG